MAPSFSPHSTPARESIAARFGDEAFLRMPYCCRVFAENLLRHGNGNDHRLAALLQRNHAIAFPFHPARAALSAPPPRVPTVDTALGPDSLVALNRGRQVFDARAGALDPDRRRLDRSYPSALIRIVDGVPFPDSLVGTDRHTATISALGVLGWCVSAGEVATAVRGQPLLLRLPEVIGIEIVGTLAPRHTADGLRHALCEFLLAQDVAGAIVEFRGAGVAALSVFDRAAVSYRAADIGAMAALFAIDANTLDYLRRGPHSALTLTLDEVYSRRQGLTPASLAHAHYDRVRVFDLAAV